MKSLARSRLPSLLVFGTLLYLAPAFAPALQHAAAQPAGVPPGLEAIGVDEKLGARLPADVELRDHTGRTVRLGSLVKNGRPSILALGYYTCPVLCNLVFDALVDGLRDVSWSAGRDFNVVFVSIDGRDTPERAAKKRAEVVQRYGRSDAQLGWSFLVGRAEDTARIAKAVGFKYEWDARQEQYAHPAALTLLSPDGTVSRYLYGLRFNASDLRLGLIDAAEGEQVGALERVLMYCYRYDPQNGRYVLIATRVMQLGGLITILIVGLVMGVYWTHERRRRMPFRPSDGLAQGSGAAPGAEQGALSRSVFEGRSAPEGQSALDTSATGSSPLGSTPLGPPTLIEGGHARA